MAEAVEWPRRQAEAINGMLERILAVTLSSSKADASKRPPVIFLSALAQELGAEQQQRAGGAPLITADNLDAVVVSRLIEAPPPQDSYPQLPFPYLLGCYERARGELRQLAGASAALAGAPDGWAAALRGAAASCRDLVVSYAGLVLTGSGVVPEPDWAAERGPLQLCDAAMAAACASQGQAFSPPAGQVGQVVPLPPGLLEDLAARQDGEAMGQVLGPVVRELARAVQACSLLGNYAAPLSAVRQMVSSEALARVLVGLPSFLPDLATGSGRALQLPGASWLGPCFSPSAIPDALVAAAPDVGDACYNGFSLGQRNQGDVARHQGTLRLAARHITGELAAISKALLGKATRPHMLAWLANALEGNRERAKMQVDFNVAASNGMFVNLCAVLLKLCGPFLDPGSGLFWKRVDWQYVVLGPRLDFSEETRLAVSLPQAKEWVARERAAQQQQQQQQQQDAAGAGAGASSSNGAQAGAQGGGGDGDGSGGYHFICECFFITLKALHLGVIKVISDLDWQGQHMAGAGRELREVEAAASRAAASMPPDSPMQEVISRAVAKARRELHALEGAILGADTVLGDPDLAADCLAFYRLVAAWLLSLVTPGGNINHIELPLPEEVPPAWALLPEYFVEDMADYLLHLSAAHPALLASSGAGQLEGLMLFMVVAISSPGYLKNPFLRSRLTDVLHAWLPRGDAGGGGGFRRSRMSGVGASVSHLFEGHPLVVQHMTPSLLRLYADVEVTDRHNQFYEKFNMRQNIADILLHCWSLQAHKDVWKAYAAQDGGHGPYLRFANMLVNDSIYLLDEALKHVKELRELETQLASGELAPGQQPEELQQQLERTGRGLRALLYLAGGTINTLAVTTTEITDSFLVPEMVERVAAMLNYFLLYLTGPERKSLKVRDPEKYQFDPKKLLAQICTIYLNLYHPSTSVLAAAIAGDGRSYRPAMFAEAAMVLRQFQLLGEGQVRLLEALGGQVAQAAAQGAADEEVLGEVPDEFLDPIQYTLMRDPVRLPTSDAVMDRATITRHLLSDARDPINRQPLTPDMLVPDEALAGRIRAWLREQRRAGGGGGGGAGPMTQG